jgi:localization factor PodJL
LLATTAIIIVALVASRLALPASERMVAQPQPTAADEGLASSDLDKNRVQTEAAGGSVAAPAVAGAVTDITAEGAAAVSDDLGSPAPSAVETNPGVDPAASSSGFPVAPANADADPGSSAVAADSAQQAPSTDSVVRGDQALVTQTVDTQTLPLPESIGPLALRQAALSGDPGAQLEIATRFTEGRGVPQDVGEAVRWYRLAADGGLALAQYRLGSLFEKGLGVPRDLRTAASWYRAAAIAGNIKAMHNLAVLSAEGIEGTPDYVAAALWFQVAAELGVRDSQYNLGILHAKGLGVELDMIASYKWFAIAANGGDTDAARKRDDIAQVLDKEALARARLAVETWSARTPAASANEAPAGDPAWLMVPEQTASVRPAEASIADIQTRLANLGYDPGPADGRVGERTRMAIEKFQADRGLEVTGAVDAGLVQALSEQQI